MFGLIWLDCYSISFCSHWRKTRPFREEVECVTFQGMCLGSGWDRTQENDGLGSQLQISSLHAVSPQAFSVNCETNVVGETSQLE